MRELTESQHDELAQHRLWRETDGREGKHLDWSNADLRNTYMYGANLYGADLRGADLRGAELCDAFLEGADFNGANLSDAKGLISQREWLQQFEMQDGLIVAYKVQVHLFEAEWPATWKWKAGAVLEEVVNPCRSTECGCGVNIATLEWCKQARLDAPIWRVLVDPRGVVVPYNTDGKFRAEWVRLVEVLTFEVINA